MLRTNSAFPAIPLAVQGPLWDVFPKVKSRTKLRKIVVKMINANGDKYTA